MISINHLLVWAPVILLAAVVLLGSYLYFSLKVELKLITRRTVSRAELEARVSEMVTELESLRARQLAAEVHPVSSHDWTSQSLNLNRRGQILRLHGKGRSTAEIASDLEISQGEVELLLKVHDWPTASAL
jgi:DNA-binding NarL/FixJ family response regulator